MDGRADPCADPGFFVGGGGGGGGQGPTARIQDPHMRPIHTRTHAERHMNVHAQADG